MSFTKNLFLYDYFPLPLGPTPFSTILNDVFFNPAKDNQDYPIHGPNVIRFVELLLKCKLETDNGLLAGDNKDQAIITYQRYYPKILEALEIPSDFQACPELGKVLSLLKVAALFHDLGKVIRRANHPQVGANLLRSFDEEQSRLLLDYLVYEGEQPNTLSKYSRFSLMASIIQHHDKFGVVSTGEGALPIFSDILYFTSNKGAIPGITKNVTAVMLLNLADIAAVCKVIDKKPALDLAANIYRLRHGDSPLPSHVGKTERELADQLLNLCRCADTCLGLVPEKLSNVLGDWDILVSAVKETQGDRTLLKRSLLNIEQNPSRGILRILRLLNESALTSEAPSLLSYMSPISVESVLVGTLGPQEFQAFCEQFATVVKLDYALDFFKGLLCACIRRELDTNYTIDSPLGSEATWRKLSDDEKAQVVSWDQKKAAEITGKITTLFVKVLASLISRYSGVIGQASVNPRRFGFQLRDLTLDEKIRSAILDLLCIQNSKDHIALTWIADEVTIWSFD